MSTCPPAFPRIFSILLIPLNVVDRHDKRAVFSFSGSRAFSLVRGMIRYRHCETGGREVARRDRWIDPVVMRRLGVLHAIPALLCTLPHPISILLGRSLCGRALSTFHLRVLCRRDPSLPDQGRQGLCNSKSDFRTTAYYTLVHLWIFEQKSAILGCGIFDGRDRSTATDGGWIWRQSAST